VFSRSGAARLAVLGSAILAAGVPAGGSAADKRVSRSEEITVQGRLFCSLKRPVLFPYSGIIASLDVAVGHLVTNGHALALYDLFPHEVLGLRRRVAGFGIEETEIQLAEIEHQLAGVKVEQKEVDDLAGLKMVATERVAELTRRSRLLTRRRAALQRRLDLESRMAQEEIDMVKVETRRNVTRDDVPSQAVVAAPLAGSVIWVNPEVRAQAETPRDAPSFIIGVMDPMVMRAQVHERDAVRIAVGDAATVRLESIADRVFSARVSRVSWSPLTSNLDEPAYYEVELTVPNPDFLLKEGFKGRIVFPADK
jgi:multidrug efflux pump subunit AcrA (membrane-fusion protein)